MAEFFHVLIMPSNNPERLLLADLSRTDLERRFLRPYKRGEKLTVSGQIVDPHALDRVRIIRTDAAKESAMDAVRQKGFAATDRTNADLHSSGVFIMPSLYGSDTDIEHAGEDVTAAFVKGAPGSGKDVWGYLNNRWVVGIGSAVISGLILWTLIGG